MFVLNGMHRFPGFRLRKKGSSNWIGKWKGGHVRAMTRSWFV